MRLTLVLLVASALVNLTKGLDYEEALVSLTLATVLFACRRDYVLGSRPVGLRSGLSFVAGFGLVYYAYDLLGFRVLSPWITPRPGLPGALLEPFRLVWDSPLYQYHGHQAQWFADSLIIAGCMAVAISAMLALRPLIPFARSNAADRDRALTIVRQFGRDTLSYFALREDRGYFFDTTGSAVLSYKIWRNVALVGGDPIGPAHRIAPITEQFLEFCGANGLVPCFLGSGGRHVDMYRASGLRVLKIGEESLIRLPGFDPSALKRKVRRAERHCAELGITAEIFKAHEVPAHLRDQATRISGAWVRAKGGAERGFSMTLGRFPTPADRDVRVLLAISRGSVIGFLTFVPVFGAGGWSLDMMRRGMDSPNGLTEFMVIQAARTLQREGAGFMSLNFASLSSTEATVSEPRMVTSLRRFLFDNLSSVYQLKTLYQFNSKFEPEWSSRYVVYGDLIRTGKVLMAVIQAEDPIKFSTLVSVFRRS